MIIEDWVLTPEEMAFGGDVCRHLESLHLTVVILIDDRMIDFEVDILVVDTDNTGIEVVVTEAVLIMDDSFVGGVGWSTLELHRFKDVDSFDRILEVFCSRVDDLNVVWVTLLFTTVSVDVAVGGCLVIIDDTLHDSWVHVVVNMLVYLEVFVTLTRVSASPVEVSEEVNGHHVVYTVTTPLVVVVDVDNINVLLLLIDNLTLVLVVSVVVSITFECVVEEAAVIWVVWIVRWSVDDESISLVDIVACGVVICLLDRVAVDSIVRGTEDWTVEIEHEISVQIVSVEAGAELDVANVDNVKVNTDPVVCISDEMDDNTVITGIFVVE